MDAVEAVFGRQYRDIRLGNLAPPADPAEAQQWRSVVAFLREATGFRFDSDRPNIAGLPSNVLFVGPPGTGKDTLMAWIGRVAIGCRRSVHWTNGPDMFSRIRDLIGSDRSEFEFIEHLKGFDFLAISDPCPPGGHLTESQVQWLYRIVDARQRAGRPVWIAPINENAGKPTPRHPASIVRQVVEHSPALTTKGRRPHDRPRPPESSRPGSPRDGEALSRRKRVRREKRTSPARPSVPEARKPD